MVAFLAGLALLGAGSGSESLPADPELRPDTVFRPPDGPVIAFARAPGSPAAAIRVSIPFLEFHSDAGAGHLIQMLAVQRAQRLRRMLGVEVLAARTSRELVYQVNGAVAHFDHMAGVVRELLARPEATGFVAARTRLENVNREERETPRGALRLRLRSRMDPAAPSVTGTLASLEALTHGRLVELWSASHRRANLALVVVSALAPEAALSALAEVGEAGLGPPGPFPGATARASGAPRPERIRVWYGEAYPAGDALDPRSALLARLANERLPEIESRFEPHLERWELGSASWLVLTAAAFSRDARAMRARVRGYRGDVLASLDPNNVRRAKAALRSALLVEARSPGGLAEVIGRHMDAAGAADAAADYLERLEGIDFAAMTAFLGEIVAAEAVSAEVAN